MNNDDMGREKGLNLFKLAAKNMRAYAWLNVKMCFTFACLAFLICLFTVYNAAIDLRKDTYIAESASCNYLITAKKEKLDEFVAVFDDVEFRDTFLSYSYDKAMKSAYGVSTTMTSKYTMLKVEGEPHLSVKAIGVGTIADPERGIFHKSDVTELRARYGLDSIFLSGGVPETADEVAIGEIAVEAFELGDVLGKTLECYVINPNGDDIFIFGAKVCGIIRKEYYSLSGHDSSGKIRPMFLFHRDSALFADKSKVMTNYRMYLNSLPDAELLAEAFENNSSGYCGAVRLHRANLLSKVQVLASTLYVIIGTALIISLILTIFLMIDKYMKVFSRTSGILMTMGMQKRTLFALLAFQLAILCAFAIPISFILSFTGYYVIRFLVKFVTHISLDLSIGSIVGILMIGIAIVVTIAAMFFAYVSWCLRKKTVKELLVTSVN